jgi:hypothetical protein
MAYIVRGLRRRVAVQHRVLGIVGIVEDRPGAADLVALERRLDLGGVRQDLADADALAAIVDAIDRIGVPDIRHVAARARTVGVLRVDRAQPGAHDPPLDGRPARARRTSPILKTMTPARVDGIIIANVAATSQPGIRIGATGKSSPIVTAMPAHGGSSFAARIWRQTRRARNTASSPSTAATAHRQHSHRIARRVGRRIGPLGEPPSPAFPCPWHRTTRRATGRTPAPASMACSGDDARTWAVLKWLLAVSSLASTGDFDWTTAKASSRRSLSRGDGVTTSNPHDIGRRELVRDIVAIVPKDQRDDAKNKSERPDAESACHLVSSNRRHSLRLPSTGSPGNTGFSSQQQQTHFASSEIFRTASLRLAHARRRAELQGHSLAIGASRLHWVVLDILDRSLEMAFITNEPVEIVSMPEGPAPLQKSVRLTGREGFPTTNNGPEGVTAQYLDNYMHMVRHDAPRKNAIALSVEVEECPLNYLRNRRLFEPAGTKPVIQLLVCHGELIGPGSKKPEQRSWASCLLAET